MPVAAVKPVSVDLWPALEDLFGPGGASNGCWCMYWLLGPSYHRRPRSQNREALRRAATEGPAPGLLALDDSGRALGWARLMPRSELPWLNTKRELAAVDDLPVWSLPCFYIRRTARGQGVQRALIAAAVDVAAEAGAPALEAYPVDTSVPGATRNLFPGSASTFLAAGFTEVARHHPARPILRRTS